MTSLAALTTATLDLIYGEAQVERPAEDTIDANFNAGVTVMPVSTDTLWKRNTVAEFADGERVICAADASAGAVVVRRGYRGTGDTNHVSGDVITKNPPYPISRVGTVIAEVVRHDLWPHVWAWHQDSFMFVIADHTYDLDPYVEEVVLMYQYDLNGDARRHPIPNGYWDVERQTDTAVSTNKNQLLVSRVIDKDEPVYYTAKRRPHVDDLANLSAEVADLVPWAAAGKLLAGRSAQSKSDAARQRRDEGGQGFMRDYRGLMAEFLRMRAALNLTLRDEVRVEPRFRPQFRRAF